MDMVIILLNYGKKMYFYLVLGKTPTYFELHQFVE